MGLVWVVWLVWFVVGVVGVGGDGWREWEGEWEGSGEEVEGGGGRRRWRVWLPLALT